MINWMKYRFIYYAISLLVILPGTYSLLRYGLKLSIEFTGGSVLIFSNLSQKPADFLKTINDSTAEITRTNDQTTSIRLKEITQDQADKIIVDLKKVNPKLELVSFETLGPAIGSETIKKTAYAIAFASLLLMLHITNAFKQFRFGLCAIVAMLHDSLVLLGTFSLLGHFFNIEIDLLFVTATLTVLSFSVHDTIVVYDRIRELQRKQHLSDIEDLANRAVSETMVRSLINSLTIIFMLLALVLMGGLTTRNFALALLIGSISGAYSSPFTAVPLLVTFRNFRLKKN